MALLKIIMTIIWAAVFSISLITFIAGLASWNVLVIKFSLGGLLLSIPTLAAIIKDVNE